MEIKTIPGLDYDSNVYVILGWDYRQLRRYKEMEEISLEGLKVNSTDIRLVRNLGESYYFQNSFLNAVKEFEKYISYKYISYRYNRNDSYVSLIYYFRKPCQMPDNYPVRLLIVKLPKFCNNDRILKICIYSFYKKTCASYRNCLYFKNS